ncbi:hypothetical protein JCM33374_g1207 [Metschnikowia sp. JCM 33374]|nr:hypothetical protein JCM33374_g1207 [Metschnikowia sp. JCM 33374]
MRVNSVFIFTVIFSSVVTAISVEWAWKNEPSKVLSTRGMGGSNNGIVSNKTYRASEVHTLRNGSATFAKENKDDLPENQMKRFIETLRVYVNVTSFDHILFKTHIGKLRKELREIGKSVHKITSVDQPSDQFKVVKNMFEVMVNSVENLEYFGSKDFTGCDLIYKVIELNVRITVLFNTHGALDFDFDGYLDQILLLHRNLFMWKAHFKKLTGVPLNKRFMFNRQANHADKTLEALVSYISLSDISR